MSRPFRAPSSALELVAKDGTRLGGVLLHAQRAPVRGTVVQFHGNAGNVTSHQSSVIWLTERGYDVLSFDYRGYGTSEGVPTPEGVLLDAEAALDYAREQLPRRGERDLVLLGQSLGGAVLLRALAGRRDLERVRYVVIEASFHSYQEVAASVTFRHPALFLLTGVSYGLVSDEWAPAAHVAELCPLPILFVHGLEDRVVDPRFGAALFALARAPRSLLVIPGVGHQGPMVHAPEPYRAAYLEIIENEDPRRCVDVLPDDYVCEALPNVPSRPGECCR